MKSDVIGGVQGLLRAIENDSELRELIALWPKLPGAVRRRIVGMVRRRDQ